MSRQTERQQFEAPITTSTGGPNFSGCAKMRPTISLNEISLHTRSALVHPFLPSSSHRRAPRRIAPCTSNPTLWVVASSRLNPREIY